MILKIKNFLYALFWHCYRGFPKSSQSMIEDRYSICLDCDMYCSKNKQCLECGCSINNKKVFMNKLAWADQRCPLDKW